MDHVTKDPSLVKFVSFSDSKETQDLYGRDSQSGIHWAFLKKQEASIPVDSLCARMDSYHHFQPEGKPRKHVFGFFSISKGGGQAEETVWAKELSNIHAPKKTCELMCHTEVTPSICVLRGGTVVCKRQTISREGSRGKRQDFQWLQDALP